MCHLTKNVYVRDYYGYQLPFDDINQKLLLYIFFFNFWISTISISITIYRMHIVDLPILYGHSSNEPVLANGWAL